VVGFVLAIEGLQHYCQWLVHPANVSIMKTPCHMG
jgi:hypothetical protein